MRSHGNMPVLRWRHDREAALRAAAQVLRQEPVILVMPEHVRLDLAAGCCGCRPGADGIGYDCNGPAVLRQVLRCNFLPPLRRVYEAALRVGARVDVDPQRHRLVLHD